MAPLKITIPAAHTSHEGKTFTEYEVRINHPFPRTSTTLQKRYSDFNALDSALRSQVGAPPPAPLPPKSWLGGGLGILGFGSTASSPALIETRRQGLEKYLQAIETGEDGRWRMAKVYRDFLGLNDRLDAKPDKFPGSQFGKDRVRDSSDWLDKYSEVKSHLQDVRKQLTLREQATAATAQHEAGAAAKKGLLRAGTLISALEEGLQRLGGKPGDDWGGDRLGDGEIRRRRDYISAIRKERDGLDSVLNTMAVKSAVSGSGASSSTSSAAVTSEQKSALFKSGSASHQQAPSGRRVLGAPAKETERTRELDNEGVLQLQRQIIREQDEDVVDLTTVVRRMKEMGVQINQEIVEQNAMLGLLGEDVERVGGKLEVGKKWMKKIR
ncbi:Phox homologous domain-containing protein [Massariosphaeria phaeospora]|uniref:Phox homologous domain-containing protein n=1 Tax=Massariosphaeria phaeospora TaxID=100035 RepID=A0A7C8IBL6_9PLEO|nr:Phox homologous domain-containing protein [Massariosphaeria phaeospora]